MYYVYLLKTRSRPTQPYIGATCDLRQRLKQHNEGRSPHTAKFRPWTLLAYFAFADKKTAVALKDTSNRVRGARSSIDTFSRFHRCFSGENL